MKSLKKRKIKKEVIPILVVLCVLIIFLVIGIIGFFVNKDSNKNIEATPSATTEIYDASKGVIDENEYDGTVLAKTDDAGKDYIDSTLFLGDSNTARFLSFTDNDGNTFTTKDNSIGVVGMGIDAISTMTVLDTSVGRVTMVEAVKLIQPQRIIITFGTNNLSGTSTEATNFIERYTKQLKAIEDAYPYADIIVNAIPPVAEKRDYPNVSMTQIDAYNKAIVQMCEENDWKYLNSSEVLKDETTGYAASKMMDTDGLHLSKLGLTTLFQYIREHSYIKEDTRPKPLNSIPTIIGVPSGLFTVNPLTNEDFTGDEGTGSNTQSCGANAWGDEWGCYCNDGYTGDAYSGCVVIESTSEEIDEKENATESTVESIAPTETQIPTTSSPTIVPEVTNTPFVETTSNPTSVPDDIEEESVETTAPVTNEE